MTYQETLHYLYSQLPMFTRIGAMAIKKDLTNTLALCKLLNQPQHKFKSIHVAGTNGKGSTSHMIAAVLQQAGYKVGLYTSPHLKDFRERIRINGVMIPETVVIDFVEQYKIHFEHIKPSFFEWCVALCFKYFADEQVDIAIIETGLGGRLDSTNVITPQLSIITNIGWDHMDLLGDSLPKIAAEKAGIIKPAVPVVIGEYNIETIATFTAAANKNSSMLYKAFNEVNLSNITSTQTHFICDAEANNLGNLPQLKIDLGGNYQQHNIKTVLCSLAVLKQLGYKITTKQVYEGLLEVKSNTGLAGRWQILNKEPLIIADTGHNVNGIEYVIKQITEQAYTKLHVVIGMVKDKDIHKVLQLLPKQAIYYFTQANIPRALPAQELATLAIQLGLQGNVYTSVSEAIKAAKNIALNTDLIFIGGSTFIVAEAL